MANLQQTFVTSQFADFRIVMANVGYFWQFIRKVVAKTVAVKMRYPSIKNAITCMIQKRGS